MFGGSRVARGTAEYDAAQRLGRLLAERGYAVVTGGYNGVMEAISRGSREGGGSSIGVTVGILGDAASPNEWLDEEIKTTALLERIDKLLELGSAYVVLPGGAGTFAELGIAWNLALLGGLHGKPIVVVGEGWKRVLETMIEQLHTIPADLRWMTFVDTVDEAMDAISASDDVEIATPST